MYKLILVDDEEEVRKGVLNKIEWEKYGFTVIGEAENGREALEIAEKIVPDVVVTDIKMPFMDGLKLSEILREKYPSTLIIILTGFDEFEYAHKAIQLNVVEYALKPVSSEDFINILLKVKSRIDKEIAQKEDIQVLREHYRKSLPILREKFLATLVTSKLSKEEILEKSKAYNLDLSGDGYVVSVASIDIKASGINMENGSVTQYKAPNAFNLPEEEVLLKFAVLNICEEIINKYSSDTIFLYNDYIIIISALKSTEKRAAIEKILRELEEIRQSVERFLKTTVTIGAGIVCSDIEFISTSYQSAVSALDYRLIMGNNRVIWIEDVEPKCVERVIFDDLKEHSLSSCLKVGTSNELIETIDKIFEDIIDNKSSINDYQIYLLEIITTILKVAKNSNVDIGNIFGPNYNLFVELYKFNNIYEVKNWLMEICIKIMNYISKDRNDTCKLLMHKAKEYVISNYHDCDITVNKLCQHLHISPTYFSTLFKRETKLTFINYLTQIRMDAAKELLRSTNMKALEIAEKVGFTEPNYFSYCFKKNFGISPSEYRNSFRTSAQ